MRAPLALIVIATAVAVSGCSSKGLRDIRPQGTGPDEFSVLPVKPLTQPKDYAVLPAPTPGGANLTDPNPMGDAVVALGGRESALDPGQGVPSSDQALVSASSRYGVPANTRVALAQEDADFRKRQARWTRVRLFPVDRYEQAYRKDAIDPFRQSQVFRRAGAATPSAPPEDE
ncbi:DUF3035 domain-containing protein [Ruegeria marina]|uniref:Beta-barrel assembly machine subunit BamF n=1 Tax=Ruegeria marina TaxID=639004 RepID=A0A1G6NF86_9RHOB|nr:DUF3035 domain-containing protein [Ruegeria marina]SDC66493.1 Beta-barrel assembly machine subunit BamF [Ruegeria marina]